MAIAPTPVIDLDGHMYQVIGATKLATFNLALPALIAGYK